MEKRKAWAFGRSVTRTVPAVFGHLCPVHQALLDQRVDESARRRRSDMEALGDILHVRTTFFGDILQDFEMRQAAAFGFGLFH